MTTKGGWVVGGRYGLNKTEITTADGSRHIASVITHETDGTKRSVSRDDYQAVPELVADAVLVAAAPDLLAAAKTALGLLECAGAVAVSFQADKATADMLRRAIAKAEGK